MTGDDGMINEKLRKARIEKGLSQTELAKLIGVSRQTINMIEKMIIILRYYCV